MIGLVSSVVGGAEEPSDRIIVEDFESIPERVIQDGKVFENSL